MRNGISHWGGFAQTVDQPASPCECKQPMKKFFEVYWKVVFFFVTFCAFLAAFLIFKFRTLMRSG